MSTEKLSVAPSRFERQVRSCYVRWIRLYISQPIHRQRLKLVWFIWGYGPVLTIRTLSWAERLRLLGRFLRVDWHVPHAHRPCEIAAVCRVLADRPARPGEIMVEAGCWQGGSTAKFSLVCRLLGYRLHVYDSFEGVEALPGELKQNGYDYGGQYRATEAKLRENLARYGALEVCVIHKGWFADTLAAQPVNAPVRVVYIDCDLVKGTRETLQGTVGTLVADGCVFSQDFQIEPVRTLLRDLSTWQKLGRPMPSIVCDCGNLAALRFDI
jgi:O-methyltransferase